MRRPLRAIGSIHCCTSRVVGRSAALTRNSDASRDSVVNASMTESVSTLGASSCPCAPRAPDVASELRFWGHRLGGFAVARNG